MESDRTGHVSGPIFPNRANFRTVRPPSILLPHFRAPCRRHSPSRCLPPPSLLALSWLPPPLLVVAVAADIAAGFSHARGNDAAPRLDQRAPLAVLPLLTQANRLGAPDAPRKAGLRARSARLCRIRWHNRCSRVRARMVRRPPSLTYAN